MENEIQIRVGLFPFAQVWFETGTFACFLCETHWNLIWSCWFISSGILEYFEIQLVTYFTRLLSHCLFSAPDFWCIYYWLSPNLKTFFITNVTKISRGKVPNWYSSERIPLHSCVLGACLSVWVYSVRMSLCLHCIFLSVCPKLAYAVSELLTSWQSIFPLFVIPDHFAHHHRNFFFWSLLLVFLSFILFQIMSACWEEIERFSLPLQCRQVRVLGKILPFLKQSHRAC